MTGHDQFWGVIQVVNGYQFIELVKDQKSKAKPPNFKPNDWLNVEPILQKSTNRKLVMKGTEMDRKLEPKIERIDRWRLDRN